MAAATDILSTPTDKLADLIAASATFQSWVGEVTEAAAKTHVHVVAALPDVEGIYDRPFAIVTLPRLSNAILRLPGYGSGTLEFYFESGVSVIDTELAKVLDHKDAVYSFANKVGQIQREMMEESHSSGRLFVTGISLMGVHRSMADDRDDYFYAWGSVNYGVR